MFGRFTSSKNLDVSNEQFSLVNLKTVSTKFNKLTHKKKCPKEKLSRTLFTSNKLLFQTPTSRIPKIRLLN